MLKYTGIYTVYISITQLNIYTHLHELIVFRCEAKNEDFVSTLIIFKYLFTYIKTYNLNKWELAEHVTCNELSR